MSQEKAQLIAPLGNITFSGVTATGVITATSLEGNISGAASSIKQGSSITAGVVTASSFAGNLTGNIQRLADSGPNISVGVVTATSFSGNLTGSVTDLTSQPNITVGVVTATRFSGPVTGDIRGNVTGNVSGVATGNVTGNVDGNITGNVTGTIAGNVTGNVTGNASGHASGLGINYNGGWAGAGTSQISVGVITATSFHGDGSTLDGVSGGPVSAQSVTIDGASTSIDLSSGNLIYASQSANTTVSFANSENGNVYFVRVKDDTTTVRTITWPDRIKWEGGTAPTLVNSVETDEAQIFLLVTRDSGVTWYGKEIFRNPAAGFKLFTWGNNEYGGLGHNTEASPSNSGVSSPTQVGSYEKWQAPVRMGRYSAAMTKDDGTLWTWGRDYKGNLGQNTAQANSGLSSPTQVGTDTTWSSNCAGMFNYTWVTTKTDGTLWVWGNNDTGYLGLNESAPANKSSPTQVGTDTTWGTANTSLCAGYSVHNIKTDGTLWAWGYSAGGSTGLGNYTVYSSPMQVGTDTTWSKVRTGGSGTNTGAIKTDGTLWSWGYGSQGELGLNSTPSKTTPQPVGTDTTWSDIAFAYEGLAIGLKTNGTLWTWGNNNNGRLGLNQATSVKVSSPTQVGTDTNWSKIAGGHDGGAAIKTDGTLWIWGDNEHGELGQNSPDTSALSSPTQIPGTNWTVVLGVMGLGPIGAMQG